MKKYREILIYVLPIVLVLALAVGLSEFFFQDMIDAEKQKGREELYMVRNEGADDISTRLSTSIKILNLAAEAIVTNVDSNIQDEAKMLNYLAYVQRESIFDRIDVIYPNGRILVSTGNEDEPGKWVEDTGEKTYEVLASKGSHISQRVADHHTGKQSIHFFSPIMLEGEDGLPAAILGATVYCSTLGDIFTSAHYGDNAKICMFDRRDGNIILDKHGDADENIYTYDSYELAEGYEERDSVGEIMSGKDGHVAFSSGEKGKVSYTAFTEIKNTDFSFTITVSEDTVFSSLNELNHTLMWVGIVETVLLLLIAVWIYIILYRSMQNKSRAQKAELELLQKKEQELQHQYEDAEGKKGFLEAMAVNLPAGYHRCTTDHKFQLTFVSNSFTEITGYTMEQIRNELGGSYMGIVDAEHVDYFLSMAPQLESEKHINCTYRIRRRDGAVRWVHDSTQYVERDGEKYYQCALMDITERVEELDSARREAEASNLAKSTFLFNISHDIRTPMNAIKGFIGIIKDNKGDERIVGETVGKIEQASNTLMTLMNDVLDLSRIERGKEELHLEPVRLNEQVNGLVELFASEMEEAGISFIVENDIEHTYVMCDPLKLARIGMNMISNAKKFTPRGGTVTFGIKETECDGETVTYRFYTRDTGIGMSPEFLKRAFEQFERERTSTESRVAGSGLGLAIIKRFVELMGGTASLQSELGRGTEISAVIPFAIVKDGQDVDEGSDEGKLDVAGKRVLLVEDNEFNREIAKYVLSSFELLVEEAGNGAECIEMLMSHEAGYYDVIFMDIQMPVMDGYTATEMIRNTDDAKKANIPILAMTANAFDEDRKKCLDAGMNGHIGKPIEVEALIKELSRIFRE